MKYIIPLLLFFFPVVASSQTIDVTIDNPHPWLCDILYCDTVRVDYNIEYDTLYNNQINIGLVSSIIYTEYFEPCGDTEFKPIDKSILKNKVIIVYSSLWNTEKIIDK